MAEPEQKIQVSGHEPRDLGEGFIWGVVGISAAALLACGLIVIALYPGAVSDRTLSLPLPVYPTPRLQSDPPADMRTLRAQELEQLHGKARLPIGTAMQQVAAQGIAGWPAP